MSVTVQGVQGMAKREQPQQQQRVVIGLDAHKRSVTIEVMTGDEGILGGGRYASSRASVTAS